MVVLRWNLDFLCPSTLPYWRGRLLFLTLFMCPVIYTPQWWCMVLLHVLFTFSFQLHRLTGILEFLLVLLYISSAQKPYSIGGVWLPLFCLVTSLCRDVGAPLPCLILIPCPLIASLMEYGSFYNPWSHPLAGHITAWMCVVPLYLFPPFSCPVQLHPLPQWTVAPLSCSYQLPSCTNQFTAKGKFYPNFALHYSIHILCPVTPLLWWCRAPPFHIVWTAYVAGCTISPLMWGFPSWPYFHWKGKAGMVVVLKTYNFIFVII